MTSKLIILRGNSGSGKTTVAKLLQQKLGSETMLISQDTIRRDIMNTSDTAGNLAIDLISQLAKYGHVHCQFCIIEGILDSKNYRNMLLEVIKLYDHSFSYYFDLSFEETLLRHQMKKEAVEFGEIELRKWWLPQDYLAITDEQLITKESTIPMIIDKIWKDCSI